MRRFVRTVSPLVRSLLVAAGISLGSLWGGHPISQSYWFLEVRESILESHIVVPLSDLATLLKGDFVTGDLDPQTGAAESSIQLLLSRHFRILSGDKLLPPTRSEGRVGDSGSAELIETYQVREFPPELVLEASLSQAVPHPHQTFCRVRKGPTSWEFLLTSETSTQKVPTGDPGPGVGWYSNVGRGAKVFFASFSTLLASVAVLVSGSAHFGLLKIFGIFLLGQTAGFALGLAGLTPPGAFLPALILVAACAVATESLTGARGGFQGALGLGTGLLCGLFLVFQSRPVVDASLFLLILGFTLAQVLLIAAATWAERRFHALTRFRNPVSAVCLLTGLLQVVLTWMQWT